MLATRRRDRGCQFRPADIGKEATEAIAHKSWLGRGRPGYPVWTDFA